MAVPSFFFRPPPFRFLAERLVQDEDFLSDAEEILRLTDDEYLRIAAQLAQSDAFLDRGELESVVSGAFGEDADRVTSAIHQIGRLIHDSGMDVVKAMDVLAGIIEEKVESLPPEQRRTLIERIRKLIAEPVGLAKQFKAQRLVDVTGSRLDDFQIICDIRPIFDQKHERVDGAIPLTTLQLEYTTVDGDSDVVELHITERQITQFGEKIDDARRKLKMIKDLLDRSRIMVPKTKVTVIEDEL